MLESARRWIQPDVMARLCFLGIVLSIPIGMVFTHRGTAALLASCGLVLLLGYAIARWPDLVDVVPLNADTLKRHPFFVIFVIFLIAAAVSLPGTATPGFHGGRLLEFLAPLCVIGAMLHIIRRFPLPTSLFWSVFGLVAGAALVLIELRNGSPMRAFLGLRVEEWRLNRTVVVLLLMCFPMIALSISRFGLWRGLGVGLAAATLPIIAILNSASGAAVLGLIVGAFTLLLATTLWRLTLVLTVIAAITTLLIAPWQGIILWDLIPDQWHERLRSTSSAIRVDIWRAFGWAVQDAPIFGSGFNVAAHLDREPAYLAIPEKLRGFIEFGHAHNASLQIWVEFGAFGAVLATALACLTLRLINASSLLLRPVMLAAFNASFAIAIVSHGAWQAWWAGAVGAIIILFTVIETELRISRQIQPA
jgi:O-antigen ligase